MRRAMTPEERSERKDLDRTRDMLRRGLTVTGRYRVETLNSITGNEGVEGNHMSAEAAMDHVLKFNRSHPAEQRFIVRED